MNVTRMSRFHLRRIISEALGTERSLDFDAHELRMDIVDQVKSILGAPPKMLTGGTQAGNVAAHLVAGNRSYVIQWDSSRQHGILLTVAELARGDSSYGYYITQIGVGTAMYDNAVEAAMQSASGVDAEFVHVERGNRALVSGAN